MADSEASILSGAKTEVSMRAYLLSRRPALVRLAIEQAGGAVVPEDRALQFTGQRPLRIRYTSGEAKPFIETAFTISPAESLDTFLKSLDAAAKRLKDMIDAKNKPVVSPMDEVRDRHARLFPLSDEVTGGAFDPEGRHRYTSPSPDKPREWKARVTQGAGSVSEVYLLASKCCAGCFSDGFGDAF